MKAMYIIIGLLSLPILSLAQLKADAGGDKSICLGDSTVIGGSVVASGGLAPYNYNWSPANNISNPSDSHPDVFPLNTVTYLLTVGDANGRSATDSVVITVQSPVTLTIDSGYEICFNEGYQILKIGQPMGGYYQGKGMVDSTVFDPRVSGIGTHRIVYFYYQPVCNILDSAVGHVSVNGLPKLQMTPSSDTICEGDSSFISFSGGSSYDVIPLTNVHFKDSSTISVYPTSSLAYEVVAFNNYGCSDTSLLPITVLDCDTIDEGIGSNSEDLFSFFPNPAENTLHIKVNSEYSGATLDILDESGKIVKAIALELPIIEVDISTFNPGLYLLRIDGSLESKKLIVQH